MEKMNLETSLGSCRAVSLPRALGDPAPKKKGGGFLRRYSDISNYCQFFHFSGSAVLSLHTHSEMLGCHQNKRLKRLSCQLTITGSAPMTATCDRDTEPLIWSPKIPAASICLKWVSCINQLVSINQIKVFCFIQYPINGMETQLHCKIGHLSHCVLP